MTRRERALMRSLYIRTLRRHVGPLLGFRVRNADNDLHRTSSLRGVCKGDGAVLPSAPSPTPLFVPFHEAAFTHDGSRDHGA